MKVVTRDQLEASLAELRASVKDPREGILGPRSYGWRLGGDVGLFLGGGRAGLLQLAHPMVAYAIDHHSATRADVVGRFQRTFAHVFAMIFGNLEEAFAAARRVHAIHARIHGEIREAVGGWPAGTRYHANDPEALRWVHATLVDTTLLVRARIDGPVAPGDRDGYVADMNRFGALFGIPRALLPASAAEHDAYMRQMFASDRIAVAPCAREMARFLVGRGVASARQPPLGRVTEALTHAWLPPHLAAQFELRGSPLPTRLGLGAFTALYRALPRAIAEIPSAGAARRRLDGLPPSRFAAWAERRLYALAQRATGA
ncbi:MAG: DUF2236 domain-containing protein [Deltaproteobacteria bacterium]|nr:DUF2236 domain-containing protein [Deltaproteobacteria bacterium]